MAVIYTEFGTTSNKQYPYTVYGEGRRILGTFAQPSVAFKYAAACRSVGYKALVSLPSK